METYTLRARPCVSSTGSVSLPSSGGQNFPWMAVSIGSERIGRRLLGHGIQFDLA